MLNRITQYIAGSPLKKATYPVANFVLRAVAKMNSRRYCIDGTVLVVCPGRGGSTWLAENIASILGYPILWEPLHPGNNPTCKRFGFDWQNYFSGEGTDAQRKYLRKIYDGRELSTRTLTSLDLNLSYLFSPNGYVVKHVNANMILHKIMKLFPVRSVLMIRHPCAVVSSQLKHGGWTHISKENITIPNGLFDDVPHLAGVFKKIDTLEELLAFEWAIQTYVPLAQPVPHPWFLTTYERMVVEGQHEMERILRYLGEETLQSTKLDLRKPSATAGEDAHVKQGKNRLSGWTNRLSVEQTDRILDTVHAVGVTCYNESLMPDEDLLPLPVA